MFEMISPNVTYVSADLLTLGETAPKATRIHPKGIIEIDTNMSPIYLSGVERRFEEYQSVGQLYPVTVTGLPKANGSERTGSVRFCSWDQRFAKSLTNIILQVGVPQLIMDPINGLLQFQEVSKYFRFMRYDSGGEHFPHYDSDFEVSTGSHMRADLHYITKYSLVMYFNDCDSGEIAFVEHDGIDKSDWDRQPTPEEIFLKIKPKAGKILLFPHDVCHTVLPFTDPDKQRYIARGDLIFTKVTK